MEPFAPKNPLRILVVEDNPDISENIADYFETRGHVLDFAMNGVQGLHLALTDEYDVMILDIMLPGMDGLTLCQKLRESNARKMPVLMLTARDTLPDKVSGFESGTDDYLVKPFALQELEVRIHALVRRNRPEVTDLLKIADLTVDPGTRIVRRDGKIVELNRSCMRLLEILMVASPKVVARAELEHALWGDMPPGSDSLRSHIYLLRRKIDKPFPTPLIHTVHGVGYQLKVTDEISS